MNYELKSKSILITGASRGLGRALARELAERGARVGLVGRSAPALEAVARELRARGGVATAIIGDVADPRAIHPIAAQAAEALGPVDILVNNASTLGALPLPILLDTECEGFERVLQANLLGPFRLAKALVGPMLLNGGGTVLNLSSDAAVEAYPNWGAYAVSKAALDHLTRVWAAELRGTPVRFLAVDPGEMSTKMHADALPDADPATLLDPAEVARRITRILEISPRLASGARLLAADFRGPALPQKAAL